MLILFLNYATSLLYKLRKENGSDYYFITYDRFIYDTCVDIYKASKNNPQYFPLFIKPNKWLEILTISDKECVSENVFNEILMSSAIHHAVNNVEASVISEILTRNIDKKVTDKSVLNSMFREAVNNAAIADIKNEILNRNHQDNKNETIENIIKTVLYDRMSKYDEVFKDQNEELLKAKRDRDKALRTVKYYKTQLKREIKKKK